MMEAEVMDVEPTVTVEAGKASSGSGLPTVVMPGDYRIGATLLTVSVFLGPVCHLWCAPCCIPHLIDCAVLWRDEQAVRSGSMCCMGDKLGLMWGMKGEARCGGAKGWALERGEREPWDGGLQCSDDARTLRRC